MLFMLPNVSPHGRCYQVLNRHGQRLTRFADDDDQVHPAGRHVPQTSGEPSMGLPQWIAENPEANIANTDIVLWHTFGITHFPSPETTR